MSRSRSIFCASFFLESIDVPVNRCLRQADCFGDFWNGSLLSPQIPYLFNLRQRSVGLRLHAKRVWATGIEHRPQNFFDFSQGLEHLSKGPCRIYVVEVVGLNGLSMAQEDGVDFTIGESLDKASRSLAQCFERQTRDAVIVVGNSFLESREKVRYLLIGVPTLGGPVVRFRSTV